MGVAGLRVTSECNKTQKNLFSFMWQHKQLLNLSSFTHFSSHADLTVIKTFFVSGPVQAVNLLFDIFHLPEKCLS